MFGTEDDEVYWNGPDRIPGTEDDKKILPGPDGQYGTEDDCYMFGNNKIYNYRGHLLAEAPVDDEFLLVQTVDLDDVAYHRATDVPICRIAGWKPIKSSRRCIDRLKNYSWVKMARIASSGRGLFLSVGSLLCHASASLSTTHNTTEKETARAYSYCYPEI